MDKCSFRENGIISDDKEKETIVVAVNSIEWPDKFDYLPWDMTMNLDLEGGDKEDTDYIGDIISNKLWFMFHVRPYAFGWDILEDEDEDDEDTCDLDCENCPYDDEDDEDEDEAEDEGTDGPMLDDLIDAVSKPTITGRVFAVLGVIADHGLLPSEEDDTDSEDEDCDCEDEESEEDEEVSEDEYFKMCADFLNGLANLVMESKKKDSKDTDK